jgi:hypothetical protein
VGTIRGNIGSDRMSSPFDFIKSFNDKTKYLLESAADEKDYVPFIINRGMSFTMDTVMFANAANKMAGLDKKMQHDFYYYGVPKGKRFVKWLKKDDRSDILQNIMDTYKCSINVASQYMKLLSEDHIKMIREKFEQGGKHGTGRKPS